MKIGVSGASGLVGEALAVRLKERGDEVIRLVRRSARRGEIFWNPAEGEIDAEAVGKLDAVVHLAGENIAHGRWTAAKKQRIVESRVQGTRLIAETLAAVSPAPPMLLSASAIGFYGSRGDEVMEEPASPGEGFLADACRRWEEATDVAKQAGVRVVNMRIGVVLSLRGGALAKMLPPFQWGLGGKVGTGRQYMSWITLNDVVGAIVYLLHQSSLQGPVNVVAPNPVSNAEFAKTLGRAIGRPAFLPMPAAAAKLLFGEMGEELLLSSTRVTPQKLTAAGYQFQHAELEPALRDLLGR